MSEYSIYWNRKNSTTATFMNSFMPELIATVLENSDFSLVTWLRNYLLDFNFVLNNIFSKLSLLTVDVTEYLLCCFCHPTLALVQCWTVLRGLFPNAKITIFSALFEVCRSFRLPSRPFPHSCSAWHLSRSESNAESVLDLSITTFTFLARVYLRGTCREIMIPWSYQMLYYHVRLDNSLF